MNISLLIFLRDHKIPPTYIITTQQRQPERFIYNHLFQQPMTQNYRRQKESVRDSAPSIIRITIAA
jgi:hypothetical protein